MNKLICTSEFLPFFITSREPGDSALTAHKVGAGTGRYKHPQAPPGPFPGLSRDAAFPHPCGGSS